MAHSAYGLQLSVPKSWGVAYFQNCPLRKSGTLLIGPPAYESFCAEVPADANIISMQPQEAGATFSGRVRHLVVHGLGVISYSTGAAPFQSDGMGCSLQACRSHGDWGSIIGRPAHVDRCNFWGTPGPWDASGERVSHRPHAGARDWAGFGDETQLSWLWLNDGPSV